MSDYLTSLVAGIQEQSPAIRPRLTSLFEPVSRSGAFFSEPEPVAEGFESVVPKAAAGRDELQIRSTSIPLAAPLNLPPQSIETRTAEDRAITVGRTLRLSEPEHQPTAREDQRISDRDFATLSQTPLVTPTGTPSTRQIVLRPSEPSAPREIPGQEIVIEARPASPSINAPTLDPVSAQLPVLPPRNELALLSEPVEPNVLKRLTDAGREEEPGANIPHVQRDEIRGPTSVLIVPRVRLETNRLFGEPEPSGALAPAISPSPASRAKMEAIKPSPTASQRASVPGNEEAIRSESAEPVINVTIGRVEVRAVPASTSQPTVQRSAASSLMSLEDYLHQRAKRGRR